MYKHNINTRSNELTNVTCILYLCFLFHIYFVEARSTDLNQFQFQYQSCLEIPIAPTDAATRDVDYAVPTSSHHWESSGSTDVRVSLSFRSSLPAVDIFPVLFTPAALLPQTMEEIKQIQTNKQAITIESDSIRFDSIGKWRR